MSLPPPILRLPIDLLLLIIDELVFPETAHLRATCRSFTTLIPPQPSHYPHLVAAENGPWALRRNRLACVYCARMRPATAFTDRQKRAIRPWRSPWNPESRGGPEVRVCVECQSSGDWPYALEPPVNHHRTRFSEERTVRVDGRERAICRSCHSAFEKWGTRDASRAVCRTCYFHGDGSSAETAEWARLFRDMNRFGEGWGLEFEWEELQCIRSDHEWFPEWWFPPYCYCCLTDEPPRWREEHRGVQVRNLQG